MEKMEKKYILFILIFVSILLLTGCVPSTEVDWSEDKPAGFWWGLWHGIISIITFLMGVFTGGRYTIYESFNTGWGYNLGFLIGISGIIGGGVSSRRRG